MGKVHVKLNSAEVRNFLNSSEMQEMLLDHARSVAARAGEGFSADVQPGKTRAHARVSADTRKAMVENQRHNTLLKALGGKS